MRLVDLARIAAQAEGVRLRQFARRQARRGIWGAVAAVFAVFFAVMLHLTIFEFLAPVVGGGFAALIVLGLDGICAAVFGLMALRSTPGLQEREAEAISRTARAELTATGRNTLMVFPLTRAVGARGFRGAALTALLTRLMPSGRRL